MQISKNVSYNEAIKSNTATRLGIDNLPDQKQIDNMKLVADKIFQPLREFVGGPIKINSFFRSPSPIAKRKKPFNCKLSVNRDCKI